MNSSCSRARGVNSESVVFFAEDIYGHDRTLGAALEQGYPYLTNG